MVYGVESKMFVIYFKFVVWSLFVRLLVILVVKGGNFGKREVSWLDLVVWRYFVCFV